MDADYAVMGMPGVGFFGMLMIGFIAGYVAEKAMKKKHGFLTNILVGVAGAFVGGTFADLLDISQDGFASNLLVAVVGAIITLWIYDRMQEMTERS